MTRIKIIPPKRPTPDRQFMVKFRYTLKVDEGEENKTESKADESQDEGTISQGLEEQQLDINQVKLENDEMELDSIQNYQDDIRSEELVKKEDDGNTKEVKQEVVIDQVDKIADEVDTNGLLNEANDTNGDDNNETNDINSNKIPPKLNEKITPIDQDYYSKLDEESYPFSFKYPPKLQEYEKPQDQVSNELIQNHINIESRLLKNLQNYKQISIQTESNWESESNQIVKTLKNWKRLFKILEYKKKQIKKSQQQSTINQFKSNDTHNPDKEINLSSNDSSNGHEESSESSDNTSKISNPTIKPIKKRKVLGNQKLEITMNHGLPAINIDSRKTRSTRSGR
ncbi:hypothetical protein BN7_1795 [Wickerhamomyces ciferrii]|uniref:Uncharacterized protein n=1 Tax=Wickerhamomyces ciferrii (strain ATCC 14091 / BCRC 22168 / CBS 111 / JCM 3599 / NBRC 0793 / NRRL Y-1031 F-60-10) TaxID=1206466 RepID=K0KGZ5_WICCF|nr:uncharacterized protein BN7_1795 [Wickerhamomyces ciferrii]CCH42251.1 hypothetical protein BN7_1795 [Wickerhamomyces ciferrii]